MQYVLMLFLLISVQALSCTGISILTEKKELVQGRTIEYGENNLKSKIVISPRGQEYQSYLPNGKVEGLKWKAKYGYVGASVLQDIFIGEGINEKGLNAGLFYFPHYGSLKRFDEKKKNNSLVDMQLVSWILSNFSSVDEVKEEIKKINIVNIGFEKDGTPLPTAHWRVADSNGKNIVIEIINNGEIKIYDNKVGVFTNSPDYDWQQKNLNNYIGLKAGNSSNYEVNGHKIFSFGAGTGAMGMPGDITPPSRFIRAFYYLTSSPVMKTTTSAVEECFHILNNFDIPIGVEYSSEHKKYIPENLPSATQWTAVSNLSEREFFYKTMYNGAIRKIDLKKIDFQNIKFTSFPMDKEKFHYEEIEI